MRSFKYGIKSLLLLTLLVATSIAGIRYWEYQKRWLQIQKKIEQLNEVVEFDKATTLRSILDLAGSDLLPRLVQHENDFVSVHAAWATICSRISEEDGFQHYRPNSEKLPWFTSIISQKMGVATPKWWTTLLADCFASNQSGFRFVRPKNNPYRTLAEDDFGWPLLECPAGHNFAETRAGFLYEADGQSIILPTEQFDSHRSVAGTIRGKIFGAFTKTHFYYDLHDEFGRPHKLWCIDRSTGEVTWSSTVCGNCWGAISMTYSRPLEAWVTIEFGAQQRVAVFGANEFGFYAHAFDRASGKPLTEFSTSYFKVPISEN